MRRLERIRQDFVSNVSHELRTPLTIIRAKAETLADDPDTDLATRTRYLQNITDEVDRLTYISADLLTLSTAESSKITKTETDLAAMLRSTVQKLEPKVKEKGLEISFEGPPSLMIQANETQMSQVALNLIDNAINYSTDGAVSVRLGRRGPDIEFEVTDTGIGIASDHLPRIFERFYRVDKGRSRATGGTGLGLAIVKHIVEAHGGRVMVESSLNQGSRFTVLLPG